MQDFQPFFSVVIPTYARPDQLIECLKSVARQDYPHHRYEVIIVDDGSPVPVDTFIDGTYDGLHLQVVSQPRAGPGAARNTGAAIAEGEILAFTDDDCLLAVDWLAALARRFATKPDAAIGGTTINALPGNPYALASQLVVDSVYQYLNVDHDEALFFATNNLAVPKDLFHLVGGFDSSFLTIEDRDFCDRWLSNGHWLVHAPNAIVYHARHMTFETFCKQHFEYGQGSHTLYEARSGRDFGTWRVGRKYYFHVLGILIDKIRDQRNLLQGGLLAVWHVAWLAGFVWQAVGRFVSVRLKSLRVEK